MNPKILNGKLEITGKTDDGKRLFIGESDNDDTWEELRIEVDTDDCDSKYAEEWAKRICDCVNACRGVVNPSVMEGANPS